MKKLRILVAIAVGGALLNACLTASAQAVKPGYATVVRVKGDASYSLDGGAHKSPLVPGKFLEAGAAIYTSDNAEVDVILGRAIDMPQSKWAPDRIALAVDSPIRGFMGYRPSIQQNAVRVMPNSTLVIDKVSTTSTGADTVGDTEIDLQKGGLYASIKKLNPAAQYLIKTPSGIAGVRGTEVQIQLNPDGTIKSFAVSHASDPQGVELAYHMPDGSTVIINILDGQIWMQGNPNPVTMPPTFLNEMRDALDSIKTTEFQIINFNMDITQFLESSDFGI